MSKATKFFTNLFFKLLLIVVVISFFAFGIKFLDNKYNFFTDNTKYDPLIKKISLKYNLDYNLVKAVIWRESRFDPRSRGSKGEVGLMQIMPKSATRSSVVEDWERATGIKINSEGVLFYPNINVDIGAWYLSKAISHWPDYEDRFAIGLAEYNAGKRNVNKWIKGMKKDERILNRIEFPSTRDYVKAIIIKYNYYKTRESNE